LPRVYLQPLGEPLSEADLTYIQAALHVFYHVEVSLRPAVPLPVSAYYSPRARFRAEKLLDYLEELAPEDSHIILGLTTVDISTTKGTYEDWGILGLASVGGGECVVSRFRAKRGAKSELHTRQRLSKTVVHEVGHTLGLHHCPHYGCLMEDGKGTVTTTDHEVDLCDTCRSQIAAHVVPRGKAVIPWGT
jgi:archaemetzincin